MIMILARIYPVNLKPWLGVQRFVNPTMDAPSDGDSIFGICLPQGAGEQAVSLWHHQPPGLKLRAVAFVDHLRDIWVDVHDVERARQPGKGSSGFQGSRKVSSLL